jgi:hypothetical protein
MRRVAAAVGIAGLLVLGACSTSTGPSYDSNDPSVTTVNGNPVTGPIDQARSVVGQQNAQLRQEEQRAGSLDPTVP